jgi:ABC-2 type transport system permease protein
MNGKNSRPRSRVPLLLSPILLAWKNDFLGRRRGGWPRRLFLIGLAAVFWGGTYWVVRRVLLYFETVYDLGPALAYQLLLLILITFLSMLLFSNIVTALSSFFLARDLDLILSLPVRKLDFFYARLITTTANSSWMVLFFSVPVFAAYNAVFHGGAVFFVWVAAILPLFITIPAALGAMIVHLLVYLLPARRIRDILFFIGLFGFILLYLLFRLSRPEQLLQPEAFGHFVEFLAAMEAPSSPYLPSSWVGEILGGLLFDRPTDVGFFYALLLSYALFLPLLASWVSGATYLVGWSKAQESRQGRRPGEKLDFVIRVLTRVFPAHMRAIMIKDAKTFLRDTTQWSQLFLLLALVVVYVYNFKVLPLDRSPLPTQTLRVAVSFANLALAGFVLSSLAVRFAFPALSLEGKAFWVLATAPLSLRSVLWGKFWLNVIPLVFFGEILVFLSNYFLRVPPWMMTLSLVTVFFMSFGITAISIGVGTLYPKFDFNHVAEIPTSFGGAVCMVLSVMFIGLCVLFEAWPAYVLALEGLRPGSSPKTLWTALPSLGAVCALSAAVVVGAMRLALKRIAGNV